MTNLFASIAAHDGIVAAALGVSPAVTYIASFLVALGVLIFVHEFGHFIVARKLGVGVTRFSFGFGPRLFGFRRGETEYLVSAIPFGGYVKMVGEADPDEVAPEDVGRSFQHKSVPVKMAIVAAGPVGNLLFAVLAFWLFLLGGVPSRVPRIEVIPGSPAAKAGLSTGDLVARVDGEAIRTWDELDERIRDAAVGGTVTLSVRRGTGEVPVPVATRVEEGRNELGERVRETGIGILPASLPRIGEVLAGSAAAKAGLAKGDLVLAVDGAPVGSWEDLAARIRKDTAGRPMSFRVRRGAQDLAVTVTPKMEWVTDPSGRKATEPRVGIGGTPESVLLRVGPVAAFGRAVEQTGKLIYLTVLIVVKLITRDVPAETLGGPILIAQMAGEQARLGLGQFFSFLGLLSVNLGILNLLPIPILDGGHLLFFSIEGIRRRSLSPRTQAIAQQFGLTVILMLMIFVFYNDIVRIDAFGALFRLFQRVFHAG